MTETAAYLAVQDRARAMHAGSLEFDRQEEGRRLVAATEARLAARQPAPVPPPVQRPPSPDPSAAAHAVLRLRYEPGTWPGSARDAGAFLAAVRVRVPEAFGLLGPDAVLAAFTRGRTGMCCDWHLVAPRPGAYDAVRLLVGAPCAGCRGRLVTAATRRVRAAAGGRSGRPKGTGRPSVANLAASLGLLAARVRGGPPTWVVPLADTPGNRASMARLGIRASSYYDRSAPRRPRMTTRPGASARP